MADATPTPTEHTLPVTFPQVTATGTSATITLTTLVISIVTTSDAGTASTGYIDFDNSDGQYNQPAGNTETDLPEPTTSYEIRWDADFTTLDNGRHVVAVHSDGVGNERTFYIFTNAVTDTTMDWGIRTDGGPDTTDLTIANFFATGRKQYRWVHSGTILTAYTRSLSFDLPLASNSSWTKEGENASGTAIADMEPLDTFKAFVFLRRSGGDGWLAGDVKVYEHRIWIDGNLESSAGMGEITLDTGANSFLDEQGNTWNWAPATDPTQTVGARAGGTSVTVTASSTVTLTEHTLGYTFPAVTVQTADAGATVEHIVSVDWDDDGSYSDVTDRTIEIGSTNLGRDPNSPQATPIVGVASVMLNNQSGDYYPDNSGSPLTGLVVPGHAIKIQATNAGVFYDLWQGHVDDYDYDVTLKQTVTIHARDQFARLVGKRISTELYAGITTGEAIGHVLDAAGATAPRDIDTGSTDIPYFWVDGQDAYAALTDLINSEGPDSVLYVTPDGVITFRGRYHRQTRAASTSSQSTWRDTGAEPQYTDYRLQHGWDDIINSVTINVDSRTPTNRQILWEYDAVPFTVPASTTVEIEARAAAPFTTSQQSLRAELKSGLFAPGGASLSRTSGQSTTISLTAPAADRIVERLWFEGVSYPVTSTVAVTRTDAASITQNGVRDPGLSIPWGYPAAVEGILDGYLNAYQDPRRTVTVEFVNVGDDTRFVNQATREVSDRVTVIETRSSTNRDFYVDTINHEMDDGGLWHATTFTLGDTVTPLVADADLFILDSATNGVLGTDKLGY